MLVVTAPSLGAQNVYTQMISIALGFFPLCLQSSERFQWLNYFIFFSKPYFTILMFCMYALGRVFNYSAPNLVTYVESIYYCR